LILLNLDLDIKHWEIDLANAFPHAEFMISNSLPKGENNCSGLLKIKNCDVSKVGEYLSNYKPKMKVEIFDNDPSCLYYNTDHCPLAGLFTNVPCFEFMPIKFNQKCKKLQVIISENRIEELLDFLKKKEMKILNFSKVKFKISDEELFTKKQRDILENALSLGYYSFPRTINLSMLAKKLSISSSTLCVHLQKIESKIIRYFDTIKNK